jgi:predicted Fe-S protein YdhL (DUF1289 family)
MSITSKTTSSSPIPSAIDTIDVEVPLNSPCISVCALDSQGFCMGCFRTGEEIRDWRHSTNEQRIQVLVLIHQREKQLNLL